MISTILYRLTSPNGKQYVGVTRQKLSKRIADHVHRKTAIGAALREYDKENFKVEVLVVGDEGYVYELEDRAISAFGTLAPQGYNVHSGGVGGMTGLHTKEAKRKMSESRKGKTLSEETRQKISEAARGRTPSRETRRKISESKKGCVFSTTQRQNMTEGLGRRYAEGWAGSFAGKKHTKEAKRKMSVARKRYLSKQATGR